MQFVRLCYMCMKAYILCYMCIKAYILCYMCIKAYILSYMCMKAYIVCYMCSKAYTMWFRYDRDKLWLVYTQIVPVIFEPPLYLNRNMLSNFVKFRFHLAALLYCQHKIIQMIFTDDYKVGLFRNIFGFSENESTKQFHLLSPTRLTLRSWTPQNVH
jgi:hypothetical protein